MARYPSAEWAPITWMNRLTHHRKTQLTVHITAGEGDPRTIATWRNGDAGSNFVIFRDGRTIQLSDSACKSAADRGATHTISVECVGLSGPLTNAQVQSLIRLARDANRLDGVPLRLAATSSDAGIGWHRLGVDGNFPKGRMGGRLQRSPLGVKTSSARGKACPTDPVINQIHDVILPALSGGANQEDDDMPSAEEVAKATWGSKIRGRDGKETTVGAFIESLPKETADEVLTRPVTVNGTRQTLGAALQSTAINAAVAVRLSQAAAQGQRLSDEEIKRIADETAAQIDLVSTTDVVDEIGNRLTGKEN